MNRTVYWGHWGITFQQGNKIVHKVMFPVGDCGPIDGYVGSAERENYRQMCRNWTERGMLPA